MYSTQKNTIQIIPAINESAVVGRYLLYPDQTGKRVVEGGLRSHGSYKQSLPELPLVTIVTVCLNSEKTLEQCIQSVMQQTYANIEYILIDGGSSDGTLDIVNKYSSAIDYYVSEPDRSLYHAMNKGLELSTGDYILILNSDDWYEIDCIDLLLNGLKASGADFSSALASYVNEEGKLVRVLPRMPYDDSCRFGMSLRHELMLISSEIYNALGGYDERFKIIADFDLAVRIYNAGYKLYQINRPLLNFRISGVSNTNWDRLLVEHKILFGSQFPEARPESLDQLCDPRALNADILDKVLNEYPGSPELTKSLVAYGYRRKFYTSVRPPSRQGFGSPRVSIVIPVYDAASTLSRCLGSVLNQQIKDIEVICIDDASRDGSLAVLKDIAIHDSRVRIIENKENIGVASSRNRGIDLARGDYLFFVDADDEITLDGLARLLDIADRNHSDIVRGAVEKVFEGNNRTVITGFPPNHKEIINTTPFETSVLIENSEGFWTCLYRRTVVRNCHFIDGMIMGEDSLFLLTCYLNSLLISWVDVVVYRYIQNETSAMNTFNFKKYIDAIEWRERVWFMLNGQGLQESADWFAHKYWNPKVLLNIDALLDWQKAEEVKSRLRKMLECTGFKLSYEKEPDSVQLILEELAGYKLTSRSSDGYDKRLKVGIFNTFDRGGAATGSIRRVIALRAAGVDATLHPLVSNSKYDFVKPLTNKESQSRCWENVNRNAILPPKSDPGFRAMELFSLPYSIIDYTKYAKLISSFDVIHLHWVVGILDYKNAGEAFANKPVVWTLADMNAFTGGCHYSEGCEGYKSECRKCPLLSSNSTLSHEAWKTKKAAYSRIKNLAIICPSEWMAERVRQSSLLSDRPVHVIPNAFPTEEFILTNQIVARLRLGLPLNKKLIMFGADSLANKRKGGDLLAAALRLLKESCGRGADDIEVVTYGNHSIDLPFHVHSLGYLGDTNKLSLAYSACDVYAFPSREDNAPLTVGEALLCGTPVVAYPVGNVVELIRHMENGYLASYSDAKDFSNGIYWAISTSADGRALKRSLQCRINAASFHSPALAAERHIALYRHMLKIA